MIKQILYDAFIAPVKDPSFKKRFAIMSIAIFMMGFSVSFLIPTNFGTDPYTATNVALADITPITFGTWQFLSNAILFVFVILFGRKHIGYGTVFNMIFIGYIADFFRWLWTMLIPQTYFLEGEFTFLWLRITVLIPSLLLFVFAAAAYIASGLGVSPYDALPFMISKLIPKMPFRILRMCYDAFFMAFSMVLGLKFGVITFCMVLMLGPAVNFAKKFIDSLFSKENL
ncbi:MAG: hypothetical protein KA785_04915 [Spirochaetaceae bacterium]|jgi:uncharacterized protein|nr:hypothetical protein [Spirochaetaceae bacterium]